MVFQLLDEVTKVIKFNLHFAEKIFALFGGPGPAVKAFDNSAEETGPIIRSSLIRLADGVTVWNAIGRRLVASASGHRSDPKTAERLVLTSAYGTVYFPYLTEWALRFEK